MFLKDIGLQFLVISLSSFGYQGNAGFIKCVGDEPSSIYFWKNLCRNSLYFFLKYLVEFTSETLGAWSVLCGKDFNYKFNFLNRHRAIKVISSERTLVVCAIQGLCLSRLLNLLA